MSEQSSGVPYKSVNTDPLGNNRTLCFSSERAINRSTAYDSSSRDGSASTWCTNQRHNYHTHTGKPTHTLPHAVGPSFLTSLLYKWQFVVPACAFTFVCRPIKSDSVSTLVYRLFCSGTFLCVTSLFLPAHLLKHRKWCSVQIPCDRSFETLCCCASHSAMNNRKTAIFHVSLIACHSAKSS